MGSVLMGLDDFDEHSRVGDLSAHRFPAAVESVPLGEEIKPLKVRRTE